MLRNKNEHSYNNKNSRNIKNNIGFITRNKRTVKYKNARN